MPDKIRANLIAHVEQLAEVIGPRTLSRPRSIAAAIEYLCKHWNEGKYAVAREEFEALGATATNLVIERPGTRMPQQIIVLGAHYDTVATTPGADDNASAVAVMLEVSRLLQDYSGSRTLRCVAFACEEPPYFNLNLMGSQHHARQAKSRHEQIVGMLCMEMVGYYRNELNSQMIPRAIPRVLHPLFPKRGNFLASVGNIASWKLAWSFQRGFKRGCKFPLFSIVLPEFVREIHLSDNRAFWEQGYPALMLTDTSFLRNPNYHQATDVPSTLDYDSMTQITLGIASALKHLLG
jgi:Zn-dependent M28 family amino/carboxypeptidase